MSEMTLAVTNPFSTQRIRPGALPFVFLDGSAQQLVVRLSDLGWRAQIVGPHGSGKSTLLQTLRPHLERAGRSVEQHLLHRGEKRLPFGRDHAQQWHAGTLVLVDGYEQLGWSSRRWLQTHCRAQGAGLLVTVHQPLRLPVLWRTTATLEIVQAVVDRLLPAELAALVTAVDVAAAYALHPGDIRETLFALYDVFEDRRGRLANSVSV